jgi:hypothetical protein
MALDLVTRCPRCWVNRSFGSAGAVNTWICSGCEWRFTFATKTPTGTSSASMAAGATAITVASGGASFTNGMILLFDTGGTPEVLVVNGTSSGTSIPVLSATLTGETAGGAAVAHLTAAAFGQLSIGPTTTTVQQVPQNAY